MTEPTADTSRLTKAATAARLCRLMNETNERLTEYREAADCFCPQSRIADEDYRNDGAALAFIEAVVDAALKAMGK